MTALGLACALTGQYIAYRLNMRVRMLEKVLVMLSSAQSSLEYLSSPSDELVHSLAENRELKNLKFLKACNEEMKNGADFRTAWETSLRDKSNTPYLKEEDISLLVSFGELFGTTDTAGQISNCRLHAEMLKDKLEEARRYCDSYASLSYGMGIVCGIGAVIILV